MKTSSDSTLWTKDNEHDQKIMVSVLATAYNHEPWVARALDGCVMQKTNFLIEILVSDDASTDRTAEIIREYEDKYPDLIKPVYLTENQFSQGNFPFYMLLEKARGKYVAICECDDYWTDPFKLQKQVDLLEAHPECSMAVAKTDVYQLEDGQFKYQRTFEGVDKELLYFDDLINDCYVHTSTYVIPKIIFNSIINKYQHKMFLGDTAMRYILIDIGPFVFLRETVSVYQITGKGIWTNLNSYEHVVAHIKLFESLYTHFKPRYKKHWGKALVSLYITIIKADIRERHLGNLPRYIARLTYLLLRYEPLHVFKRIFNRLFRLLRFIQRKMNRIAI